MRCRAHGVLSRVSTHSGVTRPIGRVPAVARLCATVALALGEHTGECSKKTHIVVGIGGGVCGSLENMLMLVGDLG